ncbi:MAG TPA: hypothetical protein VF789_00900 [Thermoanaerobaculia bacterium]
MNGSPVPPPPGSPQPPPRKGLGPLAWVGIGCGVLLVIGMVLVAAGGWFAKKQIDKFADNPGFAAAELAVRANPDLEVVNSDREKNTLTVRNKKTGEVLTFNGEDLKDGKLTVTNEKGETVDFSASQEGVKITNEKGEVSTFGATEGGPKNLPSWVPVYPGGTVQGTMDSTTGEGRTVIFTVSSQDAVDTVATFYEGKLKEAGITVEKTTMSSSDQSSTTMLGGKSADGKREASVMVSATPGQPTQAVVTVNDKK